MNFIMITITIPNNVNDLYKEQQRLYCSNFIKKYIESITFKLIRPSKRTYIVVFIFRTVRLIFLFVNRYLCELIFLPVIDFVCELSCGKDALQ